MVLSTIPTRSGFCADWQETLQDSLGIGELLIRHGLEQALRDHVDAYLETGTARNAEYYRRIGFEVVDHGEVPGEGIPIWFLRWRWQTERAR